VANGQALVHYESGWRPDEWVMPGRLRKCPPRFDPTKFSPQVGDKVRLLVLFTAPLLYVAFTVSAGGLVADRWKCRLKLRTLSPIRGGWPPFALRVRTYAVFCLAFAESGLD
jgi:hypothetical protein